VQLQAVVSVASDGRTAKARSRELNMTGVFESHGEWSEGVYENTFVKEGGVWKIKDLRYFPTFLSDYDKGWALDAQPAPTPSAELPPDRPPTSAYAIYPKAHIPPFHYDNPASGAAPRYPEARGRPSDAVRLLPRQESVKRSRESMRGEWLDRARAAWRLHRPRARACVSVQRFRQRGPTEGRLGNHVQYQPVIHVASDGQTAKVRSRMMQQLNFGQRASMGASLYENEFVKENGVWKFSVDHTFNTWTAGYDGGWARSPGRGVPGPSATFPPDTPPTFTFQMFPTVYEIPFHYPHPVTGRATSTRLPNPAATSNVAMTQRTAVDLGMPPAVAAELRTIGARIETQRTGELYAALQPKEPYAWLEVARDLKYGPHERNVLDVFKAPGSGGAAKPVVVFVHGGGFARGAKRTEGTPFYDNIGLWAVGQELVGVTLNYRLAPQSTWPSGIEDLTAAVAWLKANIEQYGGDPNRIVLWGHSAGAAHVADYVANAAKRNLDAGLAGAALTSGFYELGTEVSVWKVYYGEDVATYAERSSLPGLVTTNVPLFVSDAELDPDMFQDETAKLVAARAAAGKPLERVHLGGHSHISETYAIGTGDRSLAGPLLEFVRRVSGSHAH
jgi:acetyl esterase/lipase